jgi:hypothetical protein
MRGLRHERQLLGSHMAGGGCNSSQAEKGFAVYWELLWSCNGKAAVKHANNGQSALQCHLLLDAHFDIVLIEGVENLVEVAFHDAVELVERQVDAVVGETVLGKVVGADLF